ncbi:MAG: DUF885 domain-containing protein [Emcibacter sp.]|nr:DUF885 domain-containing protein [Emcibacter sp.]
MKKIIMTAALIVALSCAAWAEKASQVFQKILDDHWAFSLEKNPTFASDLGIRAYDGKLSHNRKEDRLRQKTYNEDILKRLNHVKVQELDKTALLNFKIFKRQRLIEQESYNYLGYLFALTNREGWHMSFAQEPANMSFQEEADYENYLGRLADYPRYNAEYIAILDEAIGQGYTHYCTAMKDYETSISSHIVDDVTKSAFYEPFTIFPAKISDEKKQDLTKRGIALIMNKVIPAYETFYKFYREKYSPNCRNTVGISGLKDGDRYYAYLIRHFTTTDMTPDDIHQIGLSEVTRLRTEMDKIITKVGFTGTFKDFITFLRNDPRFYTDDPEVLLAKTALIAKRMDGQLPNLFNFLPRNPYGIKEIPSDIAEKTTTAYYMPSQGEGRTAGNYYVNTSLRKSRPFYDMEALTFHEAVPGHHLQIAIQKELDIPLFRKFGDFTAFVEGWALYAERLGLEVGFYKDPYSDFGRLAYEMWRACRLVVDTGMHSKGWSRQKAIDFMADNTSLSIHNITTEVDRYITWPGQALAYKIGELRITALRRKAEQELGEKFDLRTFHDAVLGQGALPIAILEEIINEWIKTQK